MGIVKNVLIILVIIISSDFKKQRKVIHNQSRASTRNMLLLCNATMGIPFIAIMGVEILNSYIFQDLENIDGKRKILLTNYHVTPILEHCKVQG